MKSNFGSFRDSRQGQRTATCANTSAGRGEVEGLGYPCTSPPSSTLLGKDPLDVDGLAFGAGHFFWHVQMLVADDDDDKRGVDGERGRSRGTKNDNNKKLILSKKGGESQRQRDLRVGGMTTVLSASKVSYNVSMLML